jgi:hypothetical protein
VHLVRLLSYLDLLLPRLLLKRPDTIAVA